MLSELLSDAVQLVGFAALSSTAQARCIPGLHYAGQHRGSTPDHSETVQCAIDVLNTYSYRLTWRVKLSHSAALSHSA